MSRSSPYRRAWRSRMPRKMVDYFAFCAGLLFLAIPLSAQEFRATIVGVVTDQQGAVVPGATIKATNLATNVTLTTMSNASGTYVISYAPVGSYNLTVSANGFKNSVHENLILSVDDRVQQDFRLELV